MGMVIIDHILHITQQLQCVIELKIENANRIMTNEKIKS